MAWWSKWFERRSQQWSLSELQSWDEIGIGSGPTAAGIVVTAERALQVPAVFSCLQVLSQDVARTPIKFRQKTGPDTYEDAIDHDLYEILGSLPNPEQTAYQFKHVLQWQLLLYGRAYAEIVRQDGRIVALWPLDSRAMRVDRTAARVKRYTYTTGTGQPQVWLFDPSMPPIFELTHETPLLRCRETIATALALQTYTAKFFANGARPGGILTAQGTVSQPALDRLKATWTSTFMGSEKAHKLAVLEGGLKYEAIARPNDESQLSELHQLLTQQICGVFRIPPWKTGLMESTNYSNMQSSELSYLQSTLDPLYECWELAIRRDLLTTRQFNQFTAVFDRNALVRSDITATHQSLAIGINSGYYSVNDARKKLGENPVDGGDTYRFNTALQPITGDPNVA